MINIGERVRILENDFDKPAKAFGGTGTDLFEGKLGTVTGTLKNGFYLVAIDGEPDPFVGEGWALKPDEVEEL